jgi:hypothetical protein
MIWSDIVRSNPSMSSFPEVENDFSPLMQIIYGSVPSRLLLAAIELDVFTHLQSPTSADALAARIGTHPRNTGLLLDALVSNDLLRKRGGDYWNTSVTGEFLVNGEDTYIGDVLANFAGYLQPGLEQLVPHVRIGPPPRDRAKEHDSSSLARETAIYANHQRAGRAQWAAGIVSQLPEFDPMRKMLDLGGGAGLIGMAIVDTHPSMEGVLFDRPEVLEIARRFLHEYGLEGRVTTLGGDYLQDSIGEGYDLVWTSFTLLRSNLDPVIDKIYAALNPGGVHVSLAEGLSAERTQPTQMINSMLPMSLRWSGSMFDHGEIARSMLRAGFRSVHSRVEEGQPMHGPACLDIARK